MDTLPTSVSLDDLAARGAGGDREAEQRLLAELRGRLLPIVKRRVGEDDVEDMVQECLGIVHAKYAGRPCAGPILTWSLAVLRNVVGNHYQRRRYRSREVPFEERAQAVAGDSPSREMLEEVAGALARLARREPRCGRFFAHIVESWAEGGGQAEISRRAMVRLEDEFGAISRSALYVALHRCRARLRAILAEMGANEER